MSEQVERGGPLLSKWAWKKVDFCMENGNAGDLLSMT
jgi:hypothetical protein